MKTSSAAAVVVVGTLAVQSFFAIRGQGFLSDWMQQFLVLMAIVAVLTVFGVAFRALRLVCILIAVFLISVASIPFADAIGMRLTLVFLIALITSELGSPAMATAALAAHIAWITVLMNVSTPFRDAIGTTSIVTVAALAAWSVVIVHLLRKWMRLLNRSEETALRLGHLEATVQSLSDANVGYSDFARLARRQGLIEERHRITREIHDDIAYTLTNITMLCEAAVSSLDSNPTKSRELVQTIKHQAQTGHFETRRVLRLLRQPNHGIPHGVEALQELLQVYERSTGVKVTLRLHARRARVEHSSVSATIYHFVQECLTNAFRHGQATDVTVTLLEDGDWMYVSVRDNGIGAVVIEEGIGFHGMRERVSALGGEVAYFSDTGFVATAKIPLVSDAPVVVPVKT